jgi:hypothetical protein
MDELMGHDAELLQGTESLQDVGTGVENDWDVPVRGTKCYTVVLEFFVKTVRINLSLN